uniref:Uncharacterized protein n=1 Tax=Setaria italica TaxID=4555 RepID=K3XRE2_SETIT
RGNPRLSKRPKMSSLGSHAALTAEESKIIEDFGFGSLLQFNRCFVPKKFAQWVVRLVNYRSRDIVLNGKVISLTRESVNVVLGIPLTDKPFPDDYSVGKSIILSKFGKHFIPSVSFFAERLTKHVPMSDEDTFICFIIFGYILDWMVEVIKGFTHGKSHANSINSRSVNLVLQFIKLFAHSANNDDVSSPLVGTPVAEQQPPPTNSDNTDPFNLSFSQKNIGSSSKIHESGNHTSRVSLSDHTNDLSSKILKKSVSFEPHDDPADDVIMLNNNLPNYVPDYVSPSPRPQKDNVGKENIPIHSPPKTPITIQNLDFTPRITPKSNLKGFRGNVAFSPKIRSQAQGSHSSWHTKPQPYLIRDSSTGGKLPIHDEFVTTRNKFHVSKSEIENYNIICKLGLSQYQGEDAVNLFGVRCTYWCLGEPSKLGGLVKTYVVSAFCYNLFQKPNSHPDVSKRHYIFSNIGIS